MAIDGPISWNHSSVGTPFSTPGKVNMLQDEEGLERTIYKLQYITYFEGVYFRGYQFSRIRDNGQFHGD